MESRRDTRTAGGVQPPKNAKAAKGGDHRAAGDATKQLNYYTTTCIQALEYIGRGWSPIPIPHKSKAPVLEGWPKLRITAESAAQYFNGERQNIGVLLGQPSGNLVDVDIDCPEAAIVARHLLPDTGSIFGRPGKPSSHHLFIANCATHAFAAPGKGGAMLIELRSTGVQTVFPNSTHETGEPIEWECDNGPAEIEGERLKWLVGLIAAAALVARHWPASSRHATSLALAGALKHSGWTLKQTSLFMQVVAEAATDEEAQDRIRVCADTYAKDTPTTGWPRLSEMLGCEHVGRLTEWLGIQPSAAGWKPEGEWPEPIPFDEIDTPEIPQRLLPRVLGEFAGALAKATETPETLAVLTVVGVVSAAVTKRFRVSPKEGWYEPVNVYELVGLGPGNVKTKVFHACTEPLIEWEKEQAKLLGPEIKRQRSERKTQEKIIESLRTRAAKEKNVKDQRALICKIADMEAELIEPQALPQLFANNCTPESLENSCFEQGGRFAVLSDEGGIIEVLAGLYTKGHANVDIVLKGIDGGHVRVRRRDRNFDLNPFLTFVITAQPGVIQNMGEKRAYAGNGMLERWLYALPKSRLGYRTHDTPPVPEGIRHAYHRCIKALLDIPPLVVDDIEQARLLTLSGEAHREWRQFQHSIEVELRPKGKLFPCQGWGGKLCGYALRIAGLLHVAEHGQSQLVISGGTMAGALEIAALLMSHAIAAYDLMGVDQATEDAQTMWQWIFAQGKPAVTNGEISFGLRHQ